MNIFDKILQQKWNKRVMIKNGTVIYTVRRVREDDTRYGSFHGSADGYDTLCGKDMDHNWWIETNDWDGKITCKKCLDVLKKEMKNVK